MVNQLILLNLAVLPLYLMALSKITITRTSRLRYQLTLHRENNAPLSSSVRNYPTERFSAVPNLPVTESSVA